MIVRARVVAVGDRFVLEVVDDVDGYSVGDEIVVTLPAPSPRTIGDDPPTMPDLPRSIRA